MAQKNLGKLYPKIEGDSKFGFKYLSFITSDTVFATSSGLSGVAVEGQLRYDSSEHNFKYWNGSADTAVAVATAAGAGLDGAYDLSPNITVDGASVTLTGSTVDVLTIVQTANNDGIYISKTGTGSGAALNILNVGTGADIYTSGGYFQVSKAGNITGLDLTLTSSTVSVTGDATSGVVMALEVDTLTTGTALEIDSNTGANVTLLDLQNAGTSAFKVGGSGIVTLAGVASGTATMVLTNGDVTVTAGDINITAGDIALTAGLYSQTTDISADAFTLTDVTGHNFDLMYLNGSTCTGSGSILKIAQGAATRTGPMIDLDMGTTGVAMEAIDIDCTGGTRTAPIISIDSDGTAEDFIDMVTSVIFTGNMLSMTVDTAAATGNFIYINNDSATSMESINIDDETNVVDTILIDTAAAIGAGKAVLHVISAGTLNATANAILVDWTGITATNTPYAMNISTTAKDAGAIVITSGAATDSTVAITGSGAIADNKAVVEILGTGAPAVGVANLLRVDGSGLTATNVPTLVEIIGAGKTVQGLNIDADCTSVPVVLINGGGALTDGLGVLNLTADGALATGGNILNVTMSGTPSGVTVAAIEVACAKNCMALDIASSAVGANCVRIIGSGALTDGLAVLSVSSAANLAAGGNLLNLTFTGTPVDATVSAVDLVVSQDCLAMDIVTSAATTDAVRITGVGSIADNKALLQIAHGTGTVASGGSLIKLTGSTAATAGAYGMTIDCSGANFEALWVEAGTVLVAETLVATGGLSTIVGTTADLTATTPLSTEFDTAFGAANKTRGGFMGVVEDTTDGKLYFVASDGTTWHFAAMTAAG